MVPRSFCSGTLVGGDQDTGRAGHALDETQLLGGPVVAEQPLAAPEHEWVDHQDVAVTPAGPPQRPDQLAAAEDADVLLGPPLELGYGVGDIALDQRRVGSRQRLAE